MKIKYRGRFCGMPALINADGHVTPLIPEFIFEIGMRMYETKIFICSILFPNYYIPSFTIVFKESKQSKRFLKYYG